MSSKNCHTASTGCATSKSLLISIAPLPERPRGGLPDARAPTNTERPRGGSSDARAPTSTGKGSGTGLELGATARAAEVVGDALVLHCEACRACGHRHAADRIDGLGWLGWAFPHPEPARRAPLPQLRHDPHAESKGWRLADVQAP